MHNIQGVKNLLICPFFDVDGDPTELRGVIQYLNKQGPEPITRKDMLEASSITPAVAQVINLCSATKEVTDVSAGLARTMNDVRSYFGKKSDEFDYNLQTDDIAYYLDNIKATTLKLANSKFEAVLEEDAIFKEVFSTMQKNKYGPFKKKIPESAARLKNMIND